MWKGLGGKERARREDGCPITNVGNDVSTSGESRESDFAETWVVHLDSDPSPELRMTMRGNEGNKMDA